MKVLEPEKLEPLVRLVVSIVLFDAARPTSYSKQGREIVNKTYKTVSIRRKASHPVTAEVVAVNDDVMLLCTNGDVGAVSGGSSSTTWTT